MPDLGPSTNQGLSVYTLSSFTQTTFKKMAREHPSICNTFLKRIISRFFTLSQRFALMSLCPTLPPKKNDKSTFIILHHPNLWVLLKKKEDANLIFTTYPNKNLPPLLHPGSSFTSIPTISFNRPDLLLVVQKSPRPTTWDGVSQTRRKNTGRFQLPTSLNW